MDGRLKKDLQIRARVESIYNKREGDFGSKGEYDDYLEEREDIIFNLSEGSDVKEMERRIDEYRRDNADNIIQNEARKAEEMRQRVAADVGAHAVAEVDRAGVSGTAAAFGGGRDPEPHQGMEYTASLPSGAALASAPVPMVAVGASGDMPQPANDRQTPEEWLRMALASGWSPELPKKRALEEAFGSMLIFKEEPALS